MGSRIDNESLARWENPLVDELVVEIDTDREVFRVIKPDARDGYDYILYRWVNLAGDWHCSVDIPNASAEAMITALAARVNASHQQL